MFVFLAQISIGFFFFFCHRKQLLRMTAPHRCPCSCVSAKTKSTISSDTGC